MSSATDFYRQSEAALSRNPNLPPGVRQSDIDGPDETAPVADPFAYLPTQAAVAEFWEYAGDDIASELIDAYLRPNSANDYEALVRGIWKRMKERGLI